MSYWISYLCNSIYISIMKKFISTRLALVAAHQKTELGLPQKGGCDVRAEVCASSSKSIRHATARALRVWPQDVEYLKSRIKNKYKGKLLYEWNGR